MITLVPATPSSQTAVKSQSIELSEALNAHLPTVLGLRVKTNLQTHDNQHGIEVNKTSQQHQQQQQQQQQQHQQSEQRESTGVTSSSCNSNSLLKQQLRAGLKDLIDVTLANANNNNTSSTNLSSNHQQQNAHNMITSDSHHMDTQEACSALQSLANVAERQSHNNIQPPSANNLHHQFLLHMAANPIIKPAGEYYQQHQNASMVLREDENNLEMLMDQSDKSDPEMLTLADENAGLDYSTGNETCGGTQSGNNENLENNITCPSSNASGGQTTRRSTYGKPVQRRRVRRKAQSSVDDQAEQLTEMSVRGLDLFRYASITEGVYQCTECAKENMQKTFKNKYSFQRHAFLYHEGKHRKVFPCPLCGKEFSRPDKMKNHMKTTHETFASKEIHNFNSLNYLITAAAAGEINGSSFPANSTSNTTTSSNDNPVGLLQSSNPALSIMINATTSGENADESVNLPQPLDSLKMEQQHMTFSTEIEIKNEIVISPSPSPPPPQPQQSTPLNTPHQLPAGTTVSLADSLALLKSAAQAVTTNAQLNAQRLEEVK